MNSDKGPIRIELPTIFEMGTVNSYLFKDPEPTLIDCGEKSDASWKALLQGLKREGLVITDIERIIITHAHVDHMGMAAQVADASGAKVWVSDMVKPWAVELPRMQAERWDTIMTLLSEITNKEDSPMHQGFAQFFNNYKSYWDPIPADIIETFSIDDKLSLGDGQWDVMYAPGHCINQTCFYNKESKELIAADMLLRIASTPVIDADLEDPKKRAGGLAVMIETMKRFMQLELQTVYPGHYDPIINGNALLEKQLHRIDQRIAQTYDLISEGSKSFFEILNSMYRGRVSGPAIPMMIGYLDVLLTKKMISTSQSDVGLNYSIIAN